MPVVFDEVVGTVEPEPEPAPAGTDSVEARAEPDLDAIRQHLVRLERRAARLWAD